MRMGASGTVRDEQFHEGNGGGRVVRVCVQFISVCTKKKLIEFRLWQLIISRASHLTSWSQFFFIDKNW